MGGFFGAVSHRDIVLDVFFGTDYHSHLGTRSAGMAVLDKDGSCTREIHSIANTPFRTRFEKDLPDFAGNVGIGCISDTDPQPLLVRSHLGLYAIITVGQINNAEDLVNKYFSDHGHQFMAMGSGRVNTTELVAALINECESLTEGILHAQDVIDGSLSVLLMCGDGSLIAGRDRFGRLPVLLGKDADGYCVSFESFAYQKLGYEDERELGSGEIVEISPDSCVQLSPPLKEKKICSFLWSYYGYPTSTYEGVNVEEMRYKNGAIMAEADLAAGRAKDIDYVGGVPDSGTPHAIGYANRSGRPFARAFIKYTPTWSRSFMPATQKDRDKIAKMKQIPVHALIQGKKLLFVDDSIVRGTQLRETVDFLYENGAQEVHIRSACPPIMYACKYLNFSRSNSDMELIARRVIVELEGEDGLNHIREYADGTTERGKRMREAICEKMHFASLEFQSLEGVLQAIGINPCELCTYCWNGEE